MFLTKHLLFSRNYDATLRALFKPHGRCRATYIFNDGSEGVSQLKAFTDAPIINVHIEQPFVWMFRGCQVFMMSLYCRRLLLVFSFSYFLFLFLLLPSWLPVLVSCSFGLS